MNFDLYERIWMWGVGLMLALFFGSTAAAAFGRQIHPPSHVETINPKTALSDPRFSPQGVAVDGAGRVHARVLWFIGMLLFAVVNHITGLMGMPRRIFTDAYNGAAQAQTWAGLTRISALGGVILFASAACFVAVIAGTLLAGEKRPQPVIEWAESLGTPKEGYRAGVWDRLWLWFAIAVVLVVIAYAVPLWDLLHLTRYGSPGYKPF